MSLDFILYEKLALLAERDSWRFSELPESITPDILRVLNERGWIEFRLWDMDPVNMKPFEDSPSEPRPFGGERGWFSFGPNSGMAVDFEKMLAQNAGDSQLETEIRVTLAKRAELNVAAQLPQPADSAGSAAGVPVDQQHEAELAALVRQHPELEPDVLIHHIEESDATYANGNWHAAVNEARSFMDGLLVNIAMAESNHRREDIPGLPKSGERRSSFGTCRKYLQQIGLTQSDDDSRISACYSDASKHGSHPRIVDEDTAKLLRGYCWSTGGYLLAKYGRWKNNGHRW